MIEVEKRSFISKTKYDELVKYFRDNNYNIKEENQITTYFKGDVDFRLMKTPDYLKLWLKKGMIHDDAREEMEVIIDKKYENNLDTAKEELSSVLKEFNIDETPKIVFQTAYEDYKNNWLRYTKDVNESSFLNE